LLGGFREPPRGFFFVVVDPFFIVALRIEQANRIFRRGVSVLGHLPKLRQARRIGRLLARHPWWPRRGQYRLLRRRFASLISRLYPRRKIIPKHQRNGRRSADQHK